MTLQTSPAPMVLLAAVMSIGAAALCSAPTRAADQVDATTRVGTATRHWKVPRTPDGHPDLQGTWTNATLTPFERPDQFGNRLVLTAAEAAALERQESDFVTGAAKPSDLSRNDAARTCVNLQLGCGYNNFWIDRGSQVVTMDGEKRSSLLIDPPNGKLPPWTPERRDFMAKRVPNFDGPEARPLAERCLLAFGSSSGPPMLPVLYNNHHQIVQSKDTITILVEMVHDARIIRLGGQHVPPNVRKWMGDSIGRWEGDTLVVETTNFTDQELFRGATEHRKVTERFTRVAADTLHYRFTIEDPAAFTQSFTGELPFHLTDEPIYEYACHEGNYALPGVLAGAREGEKTARQ
jgi:hypothetical protein